MAYTGQKIPIFVFFVIAMLPMETGALAKSIKWAKYGRLKYHKTSTNSTPYIPSVGWKKAAKLLKDSMNESVDPCEDFFEFTCGKFKADHPVSDTEDIGSFNNLGFENINKLENYLKQRPKPNEPEAVKKVKSFYSSCINAQLQDIQTNFSATYNEIMGSCCDDLSEIVLRMFLYHKITIFLHPVFDANTANVSKNLLVLKPGSLSFTPFEEDEIDNYRKTIIKTLESVQKLIKLRHSDLSQYAEIILRTDIKLNSMTAAAHKENGSELLPKEMDDFFPNLHLRKMFKNLLGDAVDNEKILVIKGYLTDLNRYFKAQKSDAIDYLAWRFIQHSETHLTPRTVAGNRLQLSSDVWKMPFKTSRKRNIIMDRCYLILKNTMPFAMSRLFIDNAIPPLHLPEFTAYMKQNADELIVGFEKIIIRNSWLGWLDKNPVLKKAMRMARNIGFASWVTDDGKLNNYYNDFKIVDNIFWSNLQEANNKAQLQYFKRYFDKPNRFIFPTTGIVRFYSFVTNAVYSTTFNSINIPMSVTSPPMYDINFPKSFNYGAFGSVIGHEISHGFDTQGVTYNWNGTRVQWLSNYSLSQFTQKSQCLVDQFSHKCCFFLKTKNRTFCADGRKTLGENVAELTGLLMAYNSYKRYIAHNVAELPLPGLEKYTNKQIFWISHGNLWCGNTGDEELISKIASDPHSPSRCRVNQIIQNLPEFGHDFQCSLGSPMFPYPRDTCTVW